MIFTYVYHAYVYHTYVYSTINLSYTAYGLSISQEDNFITRAYFQYKMKKPLRILTHNLHWLQSPSPRLWFFFAMTSFTKLKNSSSVAGIWMNINWINLFRGLAADFPKMAPEPVVLPLGSHLRSESSEFLRSNMPKMSSVRLIV